MISREGNCCRCCHQVCPPPPPPQECTALCVWVFNCKTHTPLSPTASGMFLCYLQVRSASAQTGTIGHIFAPNHPELHTNLLYLQSTRNESHTFTHTISLVISCTQLHPGQHVVVYTNDYILLAGCPHCASPACMGVTLCYTVVYISSTV